MIHDKKPRVLLFFSLSSRKRAITEISMINVIDAKVSACNLSARLKKGDSGSESSTMYLLAIAANKAPTVKPKWGSE